VLPTGISFLNSTAYSILSGDPKYKDYSLKNLEVLNSTGMRANFFVTEYELTDEQFRRLLIAAKAATDEFIRSDSIHEIVEANNRFFEAAGKILLPEQSVLFFRYLVANNGLVAFLTRSDVRSEFGISNEQAKRLLATGRESSRFVKKSISQKKAEMFEAILLQLDHVTLVRLQKSLGLSIDDIAEIMAATNNAKQFVRELNPKFASDSNFLNRKRVKGIIDGGMSNGGTLMREMKSLHDALDIPYPKVLKKWVELNK
jgi:hypothetical protein